MPKIPLKAALKQAQERIKYLEKIIVKGDANELQDEVNRIQGKPIKLDSFDDIRL